jgi:hypothetical protein
VASIFGFLGLYATLVCIACSQLEKLRDNLLDIQQKHVTSEQDSDAESDVEEGQGQGQEQVETSQEVFSHMQKQLNDCICHHQEILKLMLFLLLILIVSRFLVHAMTFRQPEIAKL